MTNERIVTDYNNISYGAHSVHLLGRARMLLDCAS